ncbi:ABC transporter substrate-binding protein [Chlorobium sp. N1]|uniref:ABC transporter substrate-binding protein n=1 Tax=Chlorobium sp. N1 TaxID=2491138 RepID=UPI001F617122|nr:ABC transporter substrate-binding protein [Chlorobium sp. N1]
MHTQERRRQEAPGYRLGHCRDLEGDSAANLPLDRASIAEEPSIRESEQAQKKTLDILHYTYLFNSPGTNCINTYCPKCGELIYERDFYGPMGSKLRRSAIKANENRCPKCGHQLPVTGSVAARTFDENDFEGGYPFTRALEIIEGTLAAIGVRDRKSIVKCWESVLQKDGRQKLHGNIQDFQKYAGSIRHFATLTRREQEAEELLAYLRERVEDIREKARRTEKKPRTYYVMGTPLFSLEYQRLENTLVELAGGTSINKALAGTGRPGMKVSPEQVNEHNPEIIFISSFMQSPLDEFYRSCTELGITAEAVTKSRIHTPPIPCTDFGSPRWILGLMYIANCLHPETFSFDIETEAKAFYRKFYGMEFCLADINRSFAKPSRWWQTVS